jgi:hypothetical protein
MSCNDLNARNGATELTLWDLVAQAYNNKENLRLYEILFKAKNLWN